LRNVTATALRYVHAPTPSTMEDAVGGDEFEQALHDLNDEEEEEDDDDSPRSRLSALIWQLRSPDEVRCLLGEHPHLVKERATRRRRRGSRYRRLPIHEAIVSGQDVDVIRCCLELWPLSARERVEEDDDADEEGTDHVNHRRTEQGSLRDDDDANAARTETGLCPLQLALVSDSALWGSYSYAYLVKLLVEAWPDALKSWAPKPFLFPLNLALDAARPCMDVIKYLYELHPDPLTGDGEFFLIEPPLHR
jgi:hypothetical protein